MSALYARRETNNQAAVDVVDSKVDSLLSSPIVFSNKLRSLYNKEHCADEWVEQYQPGVDVTLTILPSGNKGLKRVRFR